MTMNNKVIIGLSAIATLISIFAISFVLLRCEPIEADWMAVLVGILSLLTASLIVWQIYRTIELDRTKRRFDRNVNDRALVVSHDIKHIITAFGHRMSSCRPIVQPESQEKSIMYLMMALEEVLKVKTPGTNRESIDSIMGDFMQVVEMHKDNQPLKTFRRREGAIFIDIKTSYCEYAVTLIKYISHAIQ